MKSFFGGSTYNTYNFLCTRSMILPPLPSPEIVVPIVGITATNNGRTCDVPDVAMLSCWRGWHTAVVYYCICGKPPQLKSLHFLFSTTAVMVVGSALRHRSWQWVHVGVYWMEWWLERLRCTHLNTLTPPATSSFTGIAGTLLHK